MMFIQRVNCLTSVPASASHDQVMWGCEGLCVALGGPCRIPVYNFIRLLTNTVPVHCMLTSCEWSQVVGSAAEKE